MAKGYLGKVKIDQNNANQVAWGDPQFGMEFLAVTWHLLAGLAFGMTPFSLPYRQLFASSIPLLPNSTKYQVGNYSTDFFFQCACGGGQSSRVAMATSPHLDDHQPPHQTKVPAPQLIYC